MIHMIVKWCMVMDKPADQSEFYRHVSSVWDEETADRFTYEAIIPEEACTTSSLTSSRS